MPNPKNDPDNNPSDSLDRLQSKVSREDIEYSLDKMYDAYVRDEVASESSHQSRVKVWEIYQELRRFFQSLKLF
ncbi:MAG: hypothetical protein AAFW73_11165 [Bacteroidota bacterium]